MKIFKFLWIFGLLHVVPERKVQTLGLNVAKAWSLLALMVPIWTSLSCSWVRDSMKLASVAICQFRSVRLPKWKVLTNTENYGPNFERMDNISWSSSSIPYCFSWSTRDLNVVKNSLNSFMVSKCIGLKLMSSFSNWCPLNSSVFPKRF